MPAKDKRIDVYISKAQPFAKPILAKLRKLVHDACPEVTETIKWGMPAFEYMGPMFSIAAFKQHCVAGFWKRSLINDPKGYLGARAAQGGQAMGNLGRITSTKDLPPDKAILDFIRQAAQLNEKGLRIKKVKPAVQKPLKIPSALAAGLARNAIAKTAFGNFTASQKREYAEWIAEAKTEETIQRRLKTAMEWISEGKTRNWKYIKKK